MALRKLDEERWGERVRRARERSGLTLREASDIVGAVIPTSFRSLNRLEQERELPSTGSRQTLAYVALLAYGFDPDDFGLADTPAGRMSDKRRISRELSSRPDNVRSLPWITPTRPLVESRAA